MKSRAKKEIIQTVNQKTTLDLQKIERDKRQKRREEQREQAIAQQRRMNTRVTEHERHPPESGHDRQRESIYDE